MKWLTKQELNLALAIAFLFFVGLAVKAYRTAQTDAQPIPEQRQ
jgi:hypothetical protein